MQKVIVEPVETGWTVNVDGVDNPVLFSRGRKAELQDATWPFGWRERAGNRAGVAPAGRSPARIHLLPVAGT